MDGRGQRDRRTGAGPDPVLVPGPARVRLHQHEHLLAPGIRRLDSEARFMPWKVAVVEDDAKLARAVATGLRPEGCQVRLASSAAEGLKVVQEWNPDVVLVDLMLSDNDGPALFLRLRAKTKAALIGMSARSMLADVVTSLKLGADDYITKPFRF